MKDLGAPATNDESAQILDDAREDHLSHGAAGVLGDPLLDIHNVARHLNVSERWVYDRVQRGAIPHLRVGKHLRFRPEELQVWMTELRSAAQPATPRWG